jgi:hypothetical protein
MLTAQPLQTRNDDPVALVGSVRIGTAYNSIDRPIRDPTH